MKALASGISQRQWAELNAAVPVYGRLREYADDADQTPLFDWLAGRMTADFGIRHARTLLAALAAEGKLLLPHNTKPYRDKLALLQRFALDSLRQATAAGRDFEVWPVRDLIATARARPASAYGARSGFSASSGTGSSSSSRLRNFRPASVNLNSPEI